MADQRELLLALLGDSPDALLVVNQAGTIESATAATERLFGYSPEELVGRPVETLIPGDLSDRHVMHRTNYLRKPEVRPMGLGLQLLARCKDGRDIPVDVSLVPTTTPEGTKVGAFVRDATERRRSEELLRSVNEVSHAVLAGEGTETLLQFFAARACDLVKAGVAWVAITADMSRQIVVTAAEGIGAESLLGASIPVAGSLAAAAMTSGTTVKVADMTTNEAVLPAARSLHLGPGLYLPMMAEDGPVGALVVARPTGAGAFSDAERTAAETFASAAAVVLALGSARQELDELRISSEHERIARDLHDTVIQRLFALGMRLQAAERLAEGPLAERLRDSVDSIDDVIREIRETIFDLNRPDADNPDVRQRLREVCSQAFEQLGFRPRLAMRGPLQTAIDGALEGDLEAVLREALANVSKHARATRVDVVLVATVDDITLSVADDGVGVTTAPSAGSGLGNLAARAAQRQGKFSLSSRQPSGTLLQWVVPVPPPDLED